MNGYRNNSVLPTFAALVCALLHLAQNAPASIPYDRPIGELYKESSLVADGRIVGISAACDEGTCRSTVYNFRITSVTKNTSSKPAIKEGDEVTFCGHGQLAIGKRYIIFMDQRSDKQSDEIMCDFHVNHDGMFMPVGDKQYFRVWSGKAYEVLTHKDEMRKSERTYFTFGIEVPGFLEIIDEAKNP